MVAIKRRIQRLAQNKVECAIKAGKLQRGYTCSLCEKTEENIDGHHPDYTKPLFIIWLCHRCHQKWHQLIREIREIGFADKIVAYFENIEIEKVENHEFVGGHSSPSRQIMSDISRRFLREY